MQGRLAPGGGEGAHRGQVGEIDQADLGAGAGSGAGVDIGGGGFAGGLVAHGQGHLRAGLGQGPGGFDADAGGRAGDDGAFAGEIMAVRHFVSRSEGAVAGGDRGRHH